MYLTFHILFLCATALLICLCLYAVRRLAKTSLYSYKIVSFLSGIFFLSMSLLHQIAALLHADFSQTLNLLAFLDEILNAFTNFAYLAFPFIILLAIFLSISNVLLIKHYGYSPTNLLGILLGAFLVLSTLILSNFYYCINFVFNAQTVLGHHFFLLLQNLLSIAICYFECLMLATIYVTFLSVRHIPTPDKDYLIILGCRIRDDGQPAGILRARLDSAIAFADSQYHTTGKSVVFIPSGGQGSDEIIPEATSMANYLRTKHFPASQILPETRSKSTFQNFKFSRQLLPSKTSKVAFATTDFHVFRSGVIASNLGYKNIEGIGAKSPWYFFNNALIREFVANLNSERQFHFYNFLVLNFFSILLITVSYFTALFS